MDPLNIMSADKTGDQELFRTLSSDAQPKALLAPPFVLLGSRLSSLLQPLPDAPLKALLAPPASARYFRTLSSDALLKALLAPPASARYFRTLSSDAQLKALLAPPASARYFSDAQLGRSAQGSPRSSSLCSIFFSRYFAYFKSTLFFMVLRNSDPLFSIAASLTQARLVLVR